MPSSPVVRLNLLIPLDVDAALRAYCQKRGLKMTAVVIEAVREKLEREGVKEE